MSGSNSVSEALVEIIDFAARVADYESSRDRINEALALIDSYESVYAFLIECYVEPADLDAVKEAYGSRKRLSATCEDDNADIANLHKRAAMRYADAIAACARGKL